MRLCTQAQSREIDESSCQGSLTEEVLIERAAQSIVTEIVHFEKNKKAKVLVLVGPGKNGADGFAVGRLLKRSGYHQVSCVLVQEKSSPSPSWLQQKRRAENSSVSLLRCSLDKLKMEISNSSIIIEAVYGTGFNRPLDPFLVELVKYLNQKNKPIFAVDIPLGLSGDTGQGMPVFLNAHTTVCFGLGKPGMFVCGGPRSVGKLKIRDLGFPQDIVKREANTHFAWGWNASRRALPKRDELSHKGNHGVLHLLAGSSQYPGAGVLAAHGAGRVGVGCVYLYGTENVYKNVPLLPEVIYRKQEDFKAINLSSNDTVLLGPGLEVGEENEFKIIKIIEDLKKHGFSKVILDAGALTALARLIKTSQGVQKRFFLPPTWILTPHGGELSRLIGPSARVLNQDRFKSAYEGSLILGGFVLFKGFRTVISSATQNKTLVIMAGNSGLAKAGSGDVLSGFIGGLLAQGLSPLHASCLGAYLHGRLARDWVQSNKDILSLQPSDLIHDVPKLIYRIRHGKSAIHADSQ